MATRRKWTEADDRLVRRNYASRGSAWLARRLGVAVHSVQNRARVLSVTAIGVVPGRLTVTDAAAEIGLLISAVHDLAVREGVLSRVGRKADGKARYGTVPVSWVEAHAKRVKAERVAAENDWTPIQVAAKAWGVGASTVRQALRGRGFVAELGIPIRFAKAYTGGNGALVVHPFDVDAVRVALDRRRRAIESMVSVAELSLAVGASRETVRRRCVRMGLAVSVFVVGGNRRSFVSRSDSTLVLAAFGVRRDAGPALPAVHEQRVRGPARSQG